MTAAAEAAGVTERTVYRWLARLREQGRRAGRSRADRQAHPAQDAARAGRGDLRAAPAASDRAEIAERCSMPLSTVSAVLKREGLGKRSRLEPPEPVNRYERRRPASSSTSTSRSSGGSSSDRASAHRPPRPRAPTETDAAGVRRGHVGWEYVHVADRRPLAAWPTPKSSPTRRPRPRSASCAARRVLRRSRHHRRARDDRQRLGLRQPRARLACAELGIRHLRTRPYRPRTNGKAERFIQTLTRAWAYGRSYSSSAERTAALDAWLDHYNFTRPHGSLGHQPPASRLTNPPRNDS